MYIVLGIIVAIVGLVMLIKPRAVYELTEGWKSNTPGEPSDFFLLSTRIGGGFFVVAGMAGAIVLAVLG